MINAATITKAVTAMLKAGLSDEYKVERGEYINMDYGKTPWVGVYRGTLDYNPSTLGRGNNNWKADFAVRIIVQASSFKNEASVVEDLLESYIEDVLAIITSDSTLGGSVAMTKGVKVAYSYNEQESENVYFQNAEIEILTEVRTS